MILRDDKKRWKLSPWLGRAIGLVLVVGLVFLVWPSPSPPPPPSRVADTETVFCGAEQMQDGHFVRNGRSFGNGGIQSDRRAHSGRYSNALLPADRMQFGLHFSLEDPVPGALYRAEVWKLDVGRARSYLAVQGTEEVSFYHTEHQTTQRQPDGWELLRLHFQIPPGGHRGQLKVYVYSDGRDTAYFDDFRLTLLAQPLPDSLRIDTLQVSIPEPALQELTEQRADALKLGLLENKPDNWVKGYLENPEVPVRMRLKGDWLDHLNGPKWSFRMEVKAPHNWKGMPVFSIQDPATRYYLHEWLLHQIWERENILTTRYDFVQVQLNQESKGVYALEEHFEAGYLDRNRKREGVVIRFQEDGFWNGLKRQLEINGLIYPALAHPPGNFEQAPIDPYDKRKVRLTPPLQKQYRQAKALLEQFREGSRPASDVFHLERLARYYAVCDLMGAYHSIKWHNQRFYFDPLVQKLEPIGFDGFGTYPEEGITILGQGLTHPDLLPAGEIFSLLFLDTAFIRLYHQELDRLTHPAYTTQLLEDLRPELYQRLQWLQADGINYQFSESDWLQTVRLKRLALWPDANHLLNVRSFHQTPEGQRTVQILNQHSLPVILTGFESANRERDYLTRPVWLPASAPRTYDLQNWLDTLGQYEDFAQLRAEAGLRFQHYRKQRRVPLRIPVGTRGLIVSIPGTDSSLVVPYRPERPPLTQAGRQLAAAPLPPVSNALYRVKDQAVQFYPGLHRIEGDLLFPEGYEIHVPAGTQIDLTQGAKFLSYSPVFLHGNEDHPVRITSSDGRNGGFTVLLPEGPSELHFVDFSGLKNMEEKGWTTTGAVTFYQADVQMAHCYFRHNQSEDALNLIDSRVDLDEIHIMNAPADGLDLDFCQGRIRRSTFRNMGNDGIDCSGSRLELSELELEQCQDKALSIGENSDVLLEDLRIQYSNQAVVVKDNSTALLDQLFISHCQSGFLAYQKKHTFGGGHIRVGVYQVEEVRKLYEVDPLSSLQLAGHLIEGDGY